jgi:manganese-dependent inorganic pyrophosphatase
MKRLAARLLVDHADHPLAPDDLKKNTELPVASDDPGIVMTALGAEPKDNVAWLPGGVSRKKQVIPPLEAAFR